MYSVRGRNAATAATADHAIWTFWNPSSTQRIRVVNFSMFAQGAAPAAGFTARLRRITARGTAGSTVTPNISNHHARGIAPPSGVVLDLAAFSVQPTLEASSVDMSPAFVFSAVQGSGLVYPIPGGLEIGPGAGVAMIQVAATASAVFEVGTSWLEDW